MLSKGQNEAEWLPQVLPQHVAIIMDGNGRWAKNRGKLRMSGHKAGAKAVRKTVRFAAKHHLKALTLYAFSSENWSRPAQEVTALMELFIWALESEVKSLHKNNVRLRVIGDTSGFNKKIQERIAKAEMLTAENSGLTLNIAANYGGRWDVVHGVKQLAEQVKKGVLQPEDITEDSLNSQLCLSDLPAVDLVIRTGGEYRISNFLIWQVAYAEFYFSPVLWPDFDEQEFQGALDAFSQRERRFGGVVSNES
ncbi:(2E,6E)-farnesyl-diphosphate-specific ditrans,polycis-undecaprenyl-diphosphate synthase [Rosenbergiella epipactidis]|uniref:(2E,6E)-farnesyl-diphosphate-specific ditrans,polycis-undecaprenyl-diphosphate synthase n=1 Tax=Rosenbergiella epipactidis TaxID=1544694 RepID=UPI001F4E42BE|nr:(2E,6E)-farnesyl-diphosphate-specific ditrans,polycis-undecaprenyl-diphosphate synthase [Rosenbergiella epipactidis]